MFCSNCGKEIADGAKFCKYCGFSMDESADIKNEVSPVNHTEIATAHNTEMDRGALLLYLQNVRDLEVAQNILKQQREARVTSYRNSYREYNVYYTLKDYPDAPEIEKTKLFWGIVVLILSALFLYAVLHTEAYKETWVFSVWGFLAGGALIGKSLKEYSEEKDTYIYECKRVDRINNNIKATNEEYKEQLPVISKQREEFCKEQDEKIERVDNLLATFYDMNIIAKEYRGNLAAVQYIYEVAESNQLSYEQICLQTKMEDGIRRVEAKMNEIISKVDEVILETRCMQNQQNEIASSLIEKNNKMLKTLQQTEQNSALTAQYSQLASNYAEANAFFSAATYLKI